MLQWKEECYEIILVGDFNEDVYAGRLARCLAEADINMKEQCRQVTGQKLPGTHVRGTKPIDGIYATTGVVCLNAKLLQKYRGVGDHRCFIVDFSSSSVIGDVFPRVVPAAGRKLTDNDRHRGAYQTCLSQLCDRHRMFRKLWQLRRESASLTDSQWLLRMNKWDQELEQFMKSAEANCRRYKQNHIEWSPEVGSWLRRRWLLARVRKFKDGKIRDPRNLFRDCKKHGIKDPRRLTREELSLEFFVTNRRLAKLAKEAPRRRREHLKPATSLYCSQTDPPFISKHMT